MPKSVSRTITVLIADDEAVARAGIRALLAHAEDIEIIGEAQDGFEVQKLVAKLHPKILLLDYIMPGPRPYELEKWIRENYPETITLVLSSHERDAYLTAMMDAGVVGYLSKKESAERLISAIRHAAQGTVYFSDEQINRAQRWREAVIQKWEGLSHREQDLLRHLAMGKDNKTIAKFLNISLKTVEFHITNILKKLNMSSRDEVIVWMLEHRPDDSGVMKD